jgi:SAM-dependent methyltransferase
MNALEALHRRSNEQAFAPRLLGLLLHPSYIIRKGLYMAIAEFAPRIRGHVLDFGCGSKPYEHLFSLAESYLGVDIEVSGHAHTDSKIDLFYDGKRLPFESSRFDAVISFEVFEHIFNLDAVLGEIHRVMRESGYLLISLPFAWEEHEIPYDCARYTSYGISRILEGHGFEIVSILKTTTYVLAIFQLIAAYISRALPTNRLLRLIGQLGLIFPCTMIGCFLNVILPTRYEYFCGCVVLAQKKTFFTSA